LEKQENNLSKAFVVDAIEKAQAKHVPNTTAGAHHK
jgi:hypothetical protein